MLLLVAVDCLDYSSDLLANTQKARPCSFGTWEGCCYCFIGNLRWMDYWFSAVFSFFGGCSFQSDAVVPLHAIVNWIHWHFTLFCLLPSCHLSFTQNRLKMKNRNRKHEKHFPPVGETTLAATGLRNISIAEDVIRSQWYWRRVLDRVRERVSVTQISWWPSKGKER